MTKPKPFLKWAGGKTQLLPELLKHVPESFDTYHEPFVGGGALFFELQPQRAVITDINAELINCYRVVRDNPERLMELLNTFPVNEQFFHKMRAEDRNEAFVMASDEWRAARIVYLNKTCFNGLYRVNGKGQLNTPWGYKEPCYKVYERSNIEAVSQYLQNNRVSISSAGFKESLGKIKLSDRTVFVYCDPPYDVLTEAANFTGYSINGFSRDDQTALKKTVDGLTKLNAKVLVSNADTSFVRNLWKDYEIIAVQAKRNINSKGTKRGNVSEVLIRNY
jgi:DNA adenine methylase